MEQPEEMLKRHPLRENACDPKANVTDFTVKRHKIAWRQTPTDGPSTCQENVVNIAGSGPGALIFGQR